MDSVFGEPVSYISMPSSNSVDSCVYSSSNTNEGVSLAGQFVDAEGLETTDGYLVGVNPYDRVYSYTTTFYAKTNGIYEFTVTGANGTEVFYLYVTNIDNDAPTVEIVGGDAEITILEGNDYEDLGIGAYDNRSFDDELTIAIDYDGLYDVDPAYSDTVPNPNSGVHNVVYSVADEAGNVTNLTKKVTVISKPLSLSTAVGTKTSTNVTLTGSVKSLGEIEVVERGIVWGLNNSPTTTSNAGIETYKYNVYNKTDFTAMVSLASLVANATYYARSYAVLTTGEIVYGDVVSFTANDKNYGTFAIEASKSITSASTVSLTITRTGGSDDAQTVYYTTRNGSAVSGTHYTATSSSVKFAAGETSKTISIPIKSTTSGWNLSSLVFYVELLSVVGGGSLNGTSRTSSIYLTTKDSFATTGMDTWITACVNEPAASISYGKNGKDTWYIPGESGYDLSDYSYWSTYGSVAGQFSVTSDMRSSDVGIYIDVKASSSGAWDKIQGDYFNSGDGVRSISTGIFDLTGQAYVLARVYTKRANLSKAYVDLSGPLIEVKYNDKSDPVVSGISASSSTYKSGDTIYFTVTYNEVVTVSNQDTVKLKLNIGETTKYATYLSGSGTTRLVFAYTVEDNLEDTDGITAQLTGTDVVKDFAGKTATTPNATTLTGVLVSTMPYTISVTNGTQNTTERSFKINVTKPSTHTGTGTTYKYAFSESASYTTEVANSLQTFTNDSSVSLEGVTGSYYLYVVVQDSLGTYVHVQGPYVMENGVPNFDTTISTQDWTNSNVIVSIEMNNGDYLTDNANLTIQYVKGENITEDTFPTTGTITVSKKVTDGAFTFNVSENGVYAILAKDSASGNSYFMNITVNNIDKVVPSIYTASIGSDVEVYANLTNNEVNYQSATPTLNVYAYDSSSQIAKMEYVFSTSTTAPTSGWSEVEDNTVSLMNGEETKTYYLYLRATDKASNVTTVKHPTGFTIPESTPPTIEVTLNGLEAGVNTYGTLEEAFTAADLTVTSPTRFTARATTISVTAEKAANGSDLLALILPSGESIYDNNVATASDGTTTTAEAIYVNGIEVKDLNSEEGIIEISYAVNTNGYYGFYAMDANGNICRDKTVITAMDSTAPSITYTLRDKNNYIVLPAMWVSEEDGMNLTVYFDDLITPIYSENGSITDYVGSKTVSYLILKDGESQYNADGTEKSYTDSSSLNYVLLTGIKENCTYTVIAKDSIGNTATKTISITNIDTNSPYVETTNTTYGVAASPIELQLKFYDKEMGLVNIAQYQITNSEETPDASAWMDYDGATISITETGTWYVHYRAEDAVGHVTTGYYGSYIIDSGKPSITITSTTADNWTESNGIITYYKDDNYASTHNATVTVDFPSTFTSIDEESVQYQWASTVIANPFGWTDVSSSDMTVDTASGTATFTVSKDADANSQGRMYLYVKVSGTSVYRSFLFDSEMPAITIIGDAPAYQIRGLSYTDRGATAYDAQEGNVNVTTKITNDDGTTTDTQFVTTDEIGEGLVQYTATDSSGNTATDSRIVYIYDNLAPYVFDFGGEINEDGVYAFTQDMFLDHYEDDTADSFASVTITTLPTNGVLRYQGTIVEKDAVFTTEQLDKLEYHPEANYYGTDTFEYKGTDTGIGERAGNTSVDAATVTITVNSVNDNPVADRVIREMDEDDVLSINMADSIYDVEDDATLVIALGTITGTTASTSNVTDLGDAVVSGQTVTYTPAADYNGTITIPYTITDSDGVTAENKISITIDNVNDNPVVSNVVITEAYGENGLTEDGLYRGGSKAQTVQITWNCSDVDNDIPTYTLYYVAGDAEPVTIISNLATTSYAWSIPEIDGEYEIRVVANDKQSENNLSVAVDSEPFVVDSTKPVVTAFTANEWVYSNSKSNTITIAANDAGNEQNENNLSVYYAIDVSTNGRTFTEGAYAFVDGSTSFDATSDEWTISTNTIAIDAEGENQVRTYVVDQAGNISLVATSGSYGQDYTAPTDIEISYELNKVEPLAGSTDTSSDVASVTITGKTADTNTGKAVSELADSPYRYAISLASSTEELVYSAWQESKTYTYENLLPNTQYTYTMQAIDAAGNVEEETITQYTLAQDAQSVTLTEWDKDTLTVTFEAPANPSGTEYQAWVIQQYGFTKVAEAAYTTGNTFTFEGLDEDKQYTVYIQAKNGDGVENAAVSFTVDTTGESFKTNDTVELTIDDQEVTAYYKADDTITFTGNVKDTDVDYHGETFIPVVEIEIGGITKEAQLTEVSANALVQLFSSSDTVTQWIWSVTYDVDTELKDVDVEDGLYQPTVTATDNKGDETVDNYEAIYIDTQDPEAPTLSDITDEANATNEKIFSNEDAISITIHANDDLDNEAVNTETNTNPSGIKEIRYQLTAGSLIAGQGQSTEDKWITVTDGDTIEIYEEGHTILTVEIEDNAGNISNITEDIYIDRTLPTESEVVAVYSSDNTKAYDGSWSNEAIDVTLTANDLVGIGEIYVMVTDSKILSAEELKVDTNKKYTFASASVLDKLEEIELTLSTNQVNYIHYMYVDTAGNEQTFVSGPYMIDTVAPAPVFTVSEKELTSEGASVVLRGHSATVEVYDYSNSGSNESEDHVSGITNMEFVWLPERITEETVLASGESFNVAEDTLTGEDTLLEDDAAGTYSWVEFTSGASLEQGGAIDGTWNLWVRLTDEAGNVAVYNQGDNQNHISSGTEYPAFKFDNDAPNLPEALDTSTGLLGYLTNQKTYGSLEVELNVNDENYDDSNSGLDEYQYVFTTSSEAPDSSTLPTFKFESYDDFLYFDSTVELNANTLADDIKASNGVSFASEVVVIPGGDEYYSLFNLQNAGDVTTTEFQVAISNVTGAIVVIDNTGAEYHYGGGYNDGNVHQIAVSIDFGTSKSYVKIYADGINMGRYSISAIDKTSLAQVTLGENLEGAIFSMSVFGRTLNDTEGKSFVFDTDDIIGDYVFCSGLEENVTNNVITDRSGQENTVIATGTSLAWDRAYETEGFLSSGTSNLILDLSEYASAFNKASKLSVGVTFKTDTGSQEIFVADDIFVIELDSDGKLVVTIGGETISTGKMLNDGRTHNVIVTVSGKTASIYLNNVLINQTELSTKWSKTSDVSSLKLGGSKGFNGTYYNFYMFERALTQGEIETATINYANQPIAVLSFGEGNKTDFDTVVQSGSGMSFDDSGDYIQAGTVSNMFGSASAINENGFTASVRFDVDEVKWTGSYQGTSSSSWETEAINGGQRLFTISRGSTSGSNQVTHTQISLGLTGDGTERLVALFRDSSDTLQKLYYDAPGILDGTHYITMSYDTNGYITVYMDGSQLGDMTYVGDLGEFATGGDAATVRIGTHLNTDDVASDYPVPSGQFYGEIYDVSFKLETTDLATHIEEATKNVVVASDNALVASYDLGKIVEGTTNLTPDSNTGYATTAAVYGVGDSGYQILSGNSSYLEANVGVSGNNISTTYEVVVSAENISQGVVFAQDNNSVATQAAFVYTRENGYRFQFYGIDKVNNGNATEWYMPSSYDETVRLTVTIEAFDTENQDYSHVKFYANGEYIGATSGNYSSYDDVIRLFDGFATTEGDQFKGTIYDVTVWNRALTAEEVAGTASPTYSDIVAHYDFSGDTDEWLTDKNGGSNSLVVKNDTAYSGLSNITYGYYAEFIGETGSTAATPLQTIVTGTGTDGFVATAEDMPAFSIDMEWEETGTASEENVFLSLRNTKSTNQAPFFLYTSSLRLFTSSNGSGTHGQTGSFGTGIDGFYDLDMSINSGWSSVTETLNGTTKELTINWATSATKYYATNGSFRIAGRDAYKNQNALMILHNLTISQDTNNDSIEEVRAQYNGTYATNADGDTVLVDISGNGRHAVIADSTKVNWVSSAEAQVNDVAAGSNANITVTTPSDLTDEDALEWVVEQLGTSDDVISVENTVVQGEVYLHVWVRDELGNEVLETYGPFDYDTTIPEITISARSYNSSDASETLTSGYVAITASDNWDLASGTRWAVVTTTSEVENPASLFTSATWSTFDTDVSDADSLQTYVDMSKYELTNITGNSATKYYIAVEAVDWLGNTATEYLYVDEETLINDNTKPTITLTEITDAQYKTTHQIQVDVEDIAGTDEKASGINEKTLYYAWSTSATSSSIETWITLDNHNIVKLSGVTGTYYLHVKASDNSGNTATEVSAVQIMDNTAPTLSATAATEWSKTESKVTVTVSDNDGGVGVETSKLYYVAGDYTSDLSAFAEGATDDVKAIHEADGVYSFIASENGTYTVYAVDKVGNETATAVTVSNMDTQAPTITISPDSQSWTSEDVTVTINVSDLGGSGISTAYYLLNSGAQQTITDGTATVTLTDTGVYNIDVVVVDGAGNETIVHTGEGAYNIDQDVNSITITPDAIVSEVVKTQTFTVAVGTTESGVAKTVQYGFAEVNADGTTGTPAYWSTATLDSRNQFTATKLTGDGAWQLVVKTTSATGVTNEASSAIVTLDNTAPEFTFASDTTAWAQKVILSITELSSDATVTLVKEGNATALIDGAASTANNVVTITENGTYTATAIDGAGNTTTKTLVVNNIDITAPTVSLDEEAADSKYIYNTEVTPTVTVSDGESGIASIEYAVKIGEVTTTYSTVQILTDGTYIVTVTVIDNAGNTAKAVGYYNIDTIAPTLAPTFDVTTDTITVTPNAMDDESVTPSSDVAITAELVGEADKTFANNQFIELLGNKSYTVKMSAADTVGNATTVEETVHTLANVPTALADVLITPSKIDFSITEGENNEGTVIYQYVIKQGDTTLYTSNMTTSTTISAAFLEQISELEGLTLEVTAYNDENVGNTTTFALDAATDEGEDIYVLNTPTTAGEDISITNAKPTVSDENVVISGTLTDEDMTNLSGTKVEVSVAGVTMEATVNADGTWSVTIPREDMLEGDYTDVSIVVVDAVTGDTTTTISSGNNIIIDKTAPAKPVIISDNTSYQREVTFTVGDTEEGATLQYSTDNSTWITITVGTMITTTEDQIYARAVDTVGNISPIAMKELLVDVAAPTMSIDPTITDSNLDDVADYSSTDETITIEYADETSLETAGYFISADGSLSDADVIASMVRATILNNEATQSVTISQDGTWYLYTYAADKAGGVVTMSGPYKIDKTAPEIPEVTVENMAVGYVGVSGIADVTDAESGVEETYYSLTAQDGTTTQYDKNINTIMWLTANAEYEIYIWAKDYLGNEAKGSTITFTTLAELPTVSNVSLGSDFVEVTLTGNEDNSVAPEYRVSFTDAAGIEHVIGWTTATELKFEDVTIPSSAFDITVQTRNIAGEESEPLIITVDGPVANTKPVVVITSENDDTKVYQDGDEITISGTVSDVDNEKVYVSATLGNVEKSVLLDANDFDNTEHKASWSFTWKITEDVIAKDSFGSYTVAVSATDETGNRGEATDSTIYYVDNQGPEAPELVEEITTLVQGDDGKYTISFATGVDNGQAGIASYVYKVDGIEKTGTGTTIGEITVNGDKEHTVEAYYVDANGNVGETTTVTFTIDSTDPEIKTTDIKVLDETTSEGWITVTDKDAKDWFSNNIKLQVTLDEACDVQVWVGTTEMTTTPATVPTIVEAGTEAVEVELAEDGTNYIYIRATDAVGNVTEACFGPYSIDRVDVPVEVAVTGSTPALGNTATITVTGQTDSVAPIETLAYAVTTKESATSLEDGDWTVYYSETDKVANVKDVLEQVVTISSDDVASGVYYVYAKTVDAAGNENIVRSTSFIIDAQVPTLDATKDIENSSAVTEIWTLIADDELTDIVEFSYLYAEDDTAYDVEDFADGVGTPIENQTLVMSANGTYTILAMDTVGNAITKVITVDTLDTEAPTIALTDVSKMYLEGWNKDVFTVTVKFADDKDIASIGYVDITTYGTGEVNEAYSSLSDIQTLIPEDTDSLDASIFTIIDGTNIATNGSMTFTLGGTDISGGISYAGDGMIMLHVAVIDSGNNVTVETFGPFKIDTTDPEIVFDSNKEVVLATQTTDDTVGEANLEGFLFSDNITVTFDEIEEGTDEIAVVSEDEVVVNDNVGTGKYQYTYSDEVLEDGFLIAKTYTDGIKIDLVDAAGNAITKTYDLTVTDTEAPVYGDGVKNALGISATNYIEVTPTEDTTYTFTVADFTPTEGVNALDEASGLDAIRIYSVPLEGDLYLQGLVLNNKVEITEDGYVEISMNDIEAGKLTYEPSQDFDGQDAEVSFLAVDTFGNVSSNLINTTTMYIKVQGVNDAPTFSNAEDIVNATTTDTKPYVCYVEVEDIDNDITDIELIVNATYEEDSIVADTDVTYRSDLGMYEVTITPVLNKAGTIHVTYTIYDGEAENNLATTSYQLTVTYEDKVVVARDDAALTDVTGEVVMDILANDDLPDTEKRYISDVTITSATAGTAKIVEEDGTFKLQYNETTVGANVVDSITYTLVLAAADGEASSAIAGDVLTATVTMNQSLGDTTFAIEGISESWCQSDEVTITVADADKLAKVVITDADGKMVIQDLAPNATSTTLNPIITANGTYTITATDLLGNVMTETFVIDKVDNSAPTIDMSGVTTESNVDHDDEYDTPNKDVISGIVAEDDSIAEVTVTLPFGDADDPDSDTSITIGPSVDVDGEPDGGFVVELGDKTTVTITPDGEGGYTVEPEDDRVSVDENGNIYVEIPDTNVNTEKDDEVDTSATIVFKPTLDGDNMTSCEVDLVLPEGTDTSDVVIGVTDQATVDTEDTQADGNQTDFALEDVTAPTFAIDRAVEQAVYYLPVSIDVTDRKNATELGAISSIEEEDGSTDSITVETNLSRMPSKATFVVESLSGAYETGATNQETYTVVVTDTYGNTNEIEITMGNIPTVDSLTRYNHEEIESIITQIEKEMATEGLTSYPDTFDMEAFQEGLQDVMDEILRTETITDKTDAQQDTTYDMTAQSPAVPVGTNVWGETTVGNNGITIKYSDNKGVLYGDTDEITYTLDTMPSFTDAGTYYVYYEMTSDYCETTTGMITYTIDKMQLSWNNDGVVADKVYDGNTVAAITTAPTLNVIEGDIIPTITVGAVNFVDENVPTTNVSAGTKVVATDYKVAESTNYLVPTTQPVIANAKITEATLTITPEAKQWTYYGETIEIDYDYSGNVTGEKPSFTGSLAIAGTAVGTYDITIGSLAQADSATYLISNYKVAFVSDVTYDVVKYEPEVAVDALDAWQSVDELTLSAPSGYEISESYTLTGNTWDDEIVIDTVEAEDYEVTYYLRNTTTGAITEAKIFVYSNDQTVPIITGVIESEIYNYEKTITITDTNLETVTVNGQVVALEDDQIVIGNDITETYTIVATDKAGLTTTVTFDMIEEAQFNVDLLIITDSEKILSDVKLPISTDGVWTWANPEQVVSVSDGTSQELEVIFTSNIPTCIPEQHTIIVTVKSPENIEIVVPTLPENATEEEKEKYTGEINNIVDEFIHALDKETVVNDDELLSKVEELDKAFIEANGTINVLPSEPVIGSDIPEEKQVVLGVSAPIGLAMAVYGTEDIDENNNIDMFLYVEQLATDEDMLLFNVKPLESINGDEPIIIDNERIQVPVTFRLYLNESFQGTLAYVVHYVGEGEQEVYHQVSVQEDEYGKYIQLTVTEFYEFSVAEYTYEVDVDGVINSYKVGDVVELIQPEKDGYIFQGWASEEVDIVENSFIMIEENVKISSQWEKIPDAAANTGDMSQSTLYILLMMSTLICGAVLMTKRRRED